MKSFVTFMAFFVSNLATMVKFSVKFSVMIKWLFISEFFPINFTNYLGWIHNVSDCRCYVNDELSNLGSKECKIMYLSEIKILVVGLTFILRIQSTEGLRLSWLLFYYTLNDRCVIPISANWSLLTEVTKPYQEIIVDKQTHKEDDSQRIIVPNYR